MPLYYDLIYKEAQIKNKRSKNYEEDNFEFNSCIAKGVASHIRHGGSSRHIAQIPPIQIVQCDEILGGVDNLLTKR